MSTTHALQTGRERSGLKCGQGRLVIGGAPVKFAPPTVVGQFDCHPEQASFAQRGIWASRAKRRVLCDALIARLVRFLIKLTHCGFAGGSYACCSPRSAAALISGSS